jgi:hypothetical protein
MTNRLDVETAIKQLPEREMRALATWLQDYIDELWDGQLAQISFDAGYELPTICTPYELMGA